MTNYIHCIGDALKTDCDVLCHQVNLNGIMGGGIARQIAIKYPSVEQEYANYPNKKLGEVCFSKTDNYVVANCFSQDNGFFTNYSALIDCMREVKDFMDDHDLNSVAFPYHYGCGIATGDWHKVLSIILFVFSDKTVKIYKLEE